MLFCRAKEITVTIKLYSGLHRELELSTYDMSQGLRVTIKNGMRLKNVLRMIGMKQLLENAYFIQGNRVGLWHRLREGDEVSCLKPSGGG